MKQSKHPRWLGVALLVVMLAASACAPGVGEGLESSSPEPAGGGSYQDELMPAATPDPAPDPETSQSPVAGEHLDDVGTITAMDDSTITVDGVVYQLTSATEIKGSLEVGGNVKLEYVTAANGSRTVIEAKSSEFFED